ncbi:MAG: pyridoxamine 5'-phosphate oxidase family protein [Nanoarchaeota archaeon]
MPSFTSPNKEPLEKLFVSVRAILENNKLLTLSTYDKKLKQPCVCSAYYCFDKELNLYIWTDPKSEHGRNIEQNSNVAVNIADTAQPLGGLLQGLQITAKAKQVTAKELLVIGALYMKRFPKVSAWVKKAIDFHTKGFQSRLYKIQSHKIKIFDEKTFGKEEYQELIFR